jgi:hypothetical protein
MKGLVRKSNAPWAHALYGQFQRAHCRKENNGDRRVVLLRCAKHIQAASVGHLLVGNDDIEFLFAKQADRFHCA